MSTGWLGAIAQRQLVLGHILFAFCSAALATKRIALDNAAGTGDDDVGALAAAAISIPVRSNYLWDALIEMASRTEQNGVLIGDCCGSWLPGPDSNGDCKWANTRSVPFVANKLCSSHISWAICSQILALIAEAPHEGVEWWPGREVGRKPTEVSSQECN